MADNSDLLQKINVYNSTNPIRQVGQPKINTGGAQKTNGAKSFTDVLKETAVKANSNTATIKTQNASGAQIKPPVADTASFVQASLLYGANFQRQTTVLPRLNFSKHASQRINERNIELTPEIADKISDAVQKAAGKNIKNALILNGNSAFIVNVDSNTVITAMKDSEMKENVITNIDGTVIL